LSNLVNPYHAGRPVEDSAMLFGRDDALIWIEQQLTLDRRLLIIYGPDLIGKTSLIRRLPDILPEPMHCLYFECKPHQGEPLSRTLAALAGGLVSQLTDQGLMSPHQIDTTVDSATAVKSLLQQAMPVLDGGQLLLILDDAHRLGDHGASLESFFDFLTNLLAEVPPLRLLVTVSDVSYGRLTHPLLAGAMTFHLGPLSSDAAQQLIIRPTQGVMHFDAGVVKRIADIVSNHPYYLHLFCYTLYNRCAREGWINQSDTDAVLKELLALPNDRFQAIWDQSSRAERATLAALASLRGAHGPVTRQEVINCLRRFDSQVVSHVILGALESLANRGVLVRMGALSYRFAVNLFRYWLDYHTDLADVLAHIDWDRLSAQPTPSAIGEEDGGVSPRASTEYPEEGEEGGRRGWGFGQWFILGLAGTALVGLALLALAFSSALPPRLLVDPTPTATPIQSPIAFASPTATPSPTPLPTPTPTRPVVVAHTLPAIVYMARNSAGSGEPRTWQIFAMNADGTNRQQWTQSGADDITPVWSPDGRRIAFVSQRDGNREIYVMNTDGSGLVNITQNRADDWTPAWSPDGQQIAFASIRQGNWEIFIVNADGSGLRQITNDGAGSMSPVWSPDGQTMAYTSKRDGNWEIYTMPAPNVQGGATGGRRRLTFSEGNDLSPIFSPQGDRIAFESNREGNVEIYIMNTDGSDQRNLTSLPYADDHGPVWSPDGRQLLFYSNREGNWDLFVMTDTGENVINLTHTPDLDEQAPAWRP
jgi:TolB protein